MQHIVIITTSYPTSHDGSEAAGSFVADFATVLANQVRVTVVAPSLTAGIEQPLATLTIHRFRVPRLQLSSLKPYYPPDALTIIKIIRAGTIALEQVVQLAPIDHIFAFWVLPSGYWAKKIGERYQIPYSTWALGSDIWSLGKIPLIKNTLKQVLRHSQRNFADGYLLKQSVETLSKRECYFLPSTRQLTLPQSAVEKQLATQPPYRLAFLGRWHFNKGTDLLVESLKHLTTDDWQHIEKIKICGGGPLEKLIDACITALQAENRAVELSGYLDKKAAVELLLWADYVLLPSRIESIPVIFSDAMKCRSPIVSMPVGDLPRLVTDYQVGVLAENVSAIAFAQAIRQALQQAPSDFESGLSRAATDFDLETIVTEFISTTD